MAIRFRPPRGLAIGDVVPSIVRPMRELTDATRARIVVALRACLPACLAGLLAGLIWWLAALLTPLEPVGTRPWAAATAFGLIVAIAATVGALAAASVAERRTATRRETVPISDTTLHQAQQQWTEAEERLRRDIAELLHGRVQTRLLVTWHKLRQCEQLMAEDPDRAMALLREVRDQIDEIREHDVRLASHRLHPSIIQVGLVPALRSLSAEFDEQVAITIHADPRLAALDDPVANRLPEPARLVAYRVVEEALSNAYRHGAATAVDITLELDRDRGLGILVRDNGRGFTSTRLTPGLGLGTIAARVAQVGGSWDISSAPGRGTVLSSYLPLTARPTTQRSPKRPAYDHRRATHVAGHTPLAPLRATLPLYQRGQPRPPAPEVVVRDPIAGM
jgi:signal transduction histidine kinase